MQKEVLVTGGAGFIGRHLVRLLVSRNYNVTVLDNYRIGGKDYVPSDLLDSATWVEGDCRNGLLVDTLVESSDAVIHLAAPSSFLMYEENPVDGTVNTIEGFLNILEAMSKHGRDRLVYASTSAVYEGNPVPYVEDMPLHPPDLKALSKKVNEEMAVLYSERYGISAIGLRPLSVYGHDEFSKGGYANVISLFVWAMLRGNQPVVWADGTQTRDFIFVEDAARAFLCALESDVQTGLFNVGTGVETSFNDVIGIINQKLSADLQPMYVAVPINIYAYRLLGDITRAESILGFSAQTTVQEGIGHVIERAEATLRQHQELAQMQLYFESLPPGPRAAGDPELERARQGA